MLAHALHVSMSYQVALKKIDTKATQGGRAATPATTEGVALNKEWPHGHPSEQIGVAVEPPL